MPLPFILDVIDQELLEPVVNGEVEHEGPKVGCRL